MAKVKVKNQKSLKSAKNKSRGSVSFAETKHGVVAKKWPRKKTKKIFYKTKEERILTKLPKGQGVNDQIALTLSELKNTQREINTKILSNIKQKPYFSGDNFVLYNGDSLNLLKELPENSVDMIFADPPYFLSNGGFTVHAGKQVSVNKGQWDVSNGLKKDFDFHLSWINECKRILKPNGTIWISGTYHSVYTCGFALEIAKYKILNDIAWYKHSAPPNLSCRYFTASHETLIWAIKDKQAKHTFNYDKMRNGNWPEDFLKNPGKQMRSVWAISAPQSWEKKFGKHPTQKPFNLLERIVLASTKENDVVLDPFTGSSTTGLAAIANDRKFIGIDTEKSYLDLSQKRFKELKNIKLI